MNIILIGDSGHGKVITDIVKSNGDDVVAKLDDKYSEIFIEDGCLYGPLSHVKELIEEKRAKVIVSIGSNPIRRKVVERLNLLDKQYATCIHKQTIISPSAKIGLGSVIMPGAIVNADAHIGIHSIVNSNSVIEHECIIEDFAHLSPGSIMAGGVELCEGVHIGAGATIIPLKKVGQWSVIGAGSVVIADIKEFSTAVGIPAKVIKTNEVN
ncbi:acetyltransferase [Planococcus sp. 4-30]|uniref:acetyltransferase n=1 Tax=Planococcus sp. 4-30 TaxID=2874583 RepID=UPI001CBB6E92|nr:acetyltransferase [Planococcus sp. 4-30]